MSRAIKLQNSDYIDSSSIIHRNLNNNEKFELSSVINDVYSLINKKTDSYYLGKNPDINVLRYISGVYGLYYCDQAPIKSIGVLEVLCYSVDWVVQRYNCVETGKMWERRFYSGTAWSSWVQRW